MIVLIGEIKDVSILPKIKVVVAVAGHFQQLEMLKEYGVLKNNYCYHFLSNN